MSAEEGHFGIQSAVWLKFDKGLRDEIQRRSGDPSARLCVLITVEGMVTEGTPVQRRQQMEAASQGLIEDLKVSDAHGIEPFWINWTIATTISLETLARIGQRRDVKRILWVVRRKVMI